MRGVLLLLLTSCLGSQGRSVEPGGRCQSDDGCGGGEVCARNSHCYELSDIRAVQVTWTVAGEPADATTCSESPNLEIDFQTGRDLDDDLGFAPVPCVSGKFSIDKLPLDFTRVRLGSNRLGFQSGTLDRATGELQLDLR